jgi:hypothetical protein
LRIVTRAAAAWNVKAGTAELISSGWRLPVPFNSHDIAAFPAAASEAYSDHL